MSDDHRETAMVAINLYSERTVACVYSKGFKLKTEGIAAMTHLLARGKVGTVGGHSAAEATVATAALLAFASGDTVLQVAKAVVDCFKAFLGHFGPKMEATDVRAIIKAVLPGLLAKTGDTSLPKRKFALAAVKSLFALEQVVHSAVAWKLVLRPVPTKMAFKVVIGRCQVVEALIIAVTITADIPHFTATEVWDFLHPLLGHKRGDIRDAAAATATALFSQLPRKRKSAFLQTVSHDLAAHAILESHVNA
jgi:hypothetical protein